MPELPEVKVVVKNLKQSVLHKKLVKIEVFQEKLFKENSISEFENKLLNVSITNITNKGKFIVFHFDNDAILLSHLRMEGKYRFYLKKHPNHQHLMAKFIFSDQSELHYLDSRMFGTFHLRNKNNYDKILPLSKMAKEPGETDVNELHQRLSKTTTAIKTKLLDQTYLVGLGNIYVDEALFASKVHPLTPSKNIPKNKLKEILEHSKRIMDKSYELGGSTIHTYESFNQQIGSYQNYLLIHNDKIKNCLNCQNKTKKIKVNGRGTYLCEKCQEKY
ncbi:DNA-formamidopyrimidine glycosylase [Metamycoplasma alkalescens]|uniref:DNA-formamidopyrimidine glycosylase n=1 Tax=Metamycoplasma alkalescens TaxID=45363 RepID=UPI003D014C13